MVIFFSLSLAFVRFIDAPTFVRTARCSVLFLSLSHCMILDFFLTFFPSFSLCASVCVCASYSLFLAKPLIFTFHFASNTVSLIPQGISKQMNSNRCEEMYQNTIYFGWFARLLSKQMESGNQNDMQYERDRQWQTDSPRRRERWREICME